jgi:hypothetical protein
VSATERRCEQLVRAADIMAGMVAESRGGYMRPPFTPSTEVRAKISREFGKTQIERLMGKEFAPSRPSVISDMITTLQACAHSEPHAVRITEWLIEYVDQWPKVSDVKKAAYETRSLESRPNPDCGKCGGSGFAEPVVKVIDGLRYEFTRKCDCWRDVSVAM